MTSADEAAADTAGLLMRLWIEPDDPDRVRVRMLTFRGDDEPRTWAVRVGEDAVVAAVAAWLRTHLQDRPEATR